MAREGVLRRWFLSIRFVFVYIFCFLFHDIPRVIMKRRKKINNQVVVITGGAMGIGRAVARQLALRELAKVCILDVNEKEGLKTVEQIRKDGGNANFFRCDISNYEDLLLVNSEIQNNPKLGPVDIVLANAAILKLGELLELSAEDYKKNNDVNILGHIYTVKAFLPTMLERRRGHIVSIGSICSHFGDYLGTAYCTSKFACRGFMEALQAELFEQGHSEICLTNIYAYFVKTTFIADIEEPFSTFFDVLEVEDVAQQIVDSILLERWTHFMPSGLTILCQFLKCLTTKSTLPHGRNFFNVTYKPKTVVDISEKLV